MVRWGQFQVSQFSCRLEVSSKWISISINQTNRYILSFFQELLEPIILFTQVCRTPVLTAMYKSFLEFIVTRRLNARYYLSKISQESYEVFHLGPPELQLNELIFSRYSTCVNPTEMPIAFFVLMEQCLTNNISFVIGGIMLTVKLNQPSMG